MGRQASFGKLLSLSFSLSLSLSMSTFASLSFYTSSLRSRARSCKRSFKMASSLFLLFTVMKRLRIFLLSSFAFRVMQMQPWLWEFNSQLRPKHSNTWTHTRSSQCLDSLHLTGWTASGNGSSGYLCYDDTGQ